MWYKIDPSQKRSHCHDDATIRAEVLNAQAEHLFSTAIKTPTANGFREAARIFAKSDALLSEVALKLLPTADASIEENRYRNEAIIFFLKNRLPRVERYTEKALLIGWLLELYLTSLAEMTDQFGPGNEVIRQHRKNFLHFLSDSVIREIVVNMKSTLYSLLHQHAAAADFNEIAKTPFFRLSELRLTAAMDRFFPDA